ncbi:Hypothetical protein A7982_03355 [Minicystis rosea]|nr:Hypothetical protein A7982_03355 [Minicystis rosea]
MCFVGGMFGAAMMGCGAPAAMPASTVALDPVVATVEPPSPSERLLALLTEDNPRLLRVSMSIVAIGDDGARRRAGARLVALARAVGSPAWREADLARFVEERSDAEAAVMTAAQAERREEELLERVFSAMSVVGGADVVALGMSMAEDEAAPVERRRMALRMVERALDARDEVGHVRAARIAAKLPASIGPNGASVPAVMAYLQRAAKSCYLRALRDDPALSGQARVTLRVDARGRVVSGVAGDALPDALRQCLTEAVRRVQTMDAQGEMVVPFLFRAQ